MPAAPISSRMDSAVLSTEAQQRVTQHIRDCLSQGLQDQDEVHEFLEPATGLRVPKEMFLDIWRGTVKGKEEKPSATTPVAVGASQTEGEAPRKRGRRRNGSIKRALPSSAKGSIIHVRTEGSEFQAERGEDGRWEVQLRTTVDAKILHRLTQMVWAEIFPVPPALAPAEAPQV